MEHDIVVDLRQVLMAQRLLLQKASGAVGELEHQFSDVGLQATEITELDTLMAGLEQNSDWLEPTDLETWPVTDEAITALYNQTKRRYADSLATLQYSNWRQFVHDSQVYCLANGVEAILPWEAMLRPEDIAAIKAESYEAQYSWDKWDYIFVGAAGTLAFLVDAILVAIPKTMTAGTFAGQKGSLLTEKLRTIQFPPAVQTWLEARSKVPFDHTGGGDHRIDTFGHDPVLGFIFGVLDIMRGGVTTASANGIAFVAGSADPVTDPLAAITIQLLHMASDVFTSKGLPVPFASILRSLNVGSFPGPGGKTHTIRQMILWMYHHGYDLRHFVTMSAVPATVEIILRAYLMIRHYVQHGEVEFGLAENPKYRSMLLSAHAVACAGNAGKVILMQGNPLAVNYAEWLALLRYLVPSLKYWMFDYHQLKLAHLNSINDQAWYELRQSSTELLTRMHRDTSPEFLLGSLQD